MTVSTSSLTVPRFKNMTFIRVMRAIWWLVACAGMLMYFVMLPINFDIFRTMPATVGSDPIADAEISAAFLQGLATLHIAPEFYAGLKILFSMIIMIVSYGMGYLVFRSRFEERIGMIGAFCFMAMGAFISIASNYQPDRTTTTGLLWDAFGWFIAIPGWGGLYLFLIVYPDGRFKPIWSVISPLVWLVGIIGMLFPQTGLGVFSDSTEEPSVLSIVLFFLMLGLPLFAQIYRYFRVFTPLQRQQVKWFLLALAWNILMIFVAQPLAQLVVDSTSSVSVVLQDIVNMIGAVSFVLIPLTVSMAIMRYRLWDIDLVINRSLVYAMVIGIILVIVAAIIAAVQIFIGDTQPYVAMVISAVVAIAVIRPLQTRIQDFVDHYIYRFSIGLNDLKVADRKPEIKNPGALTGKILGGYEVLDVIGKGGMGEVYKGFKDGQTVAIKTLPEDLAREKEFVHRFEREAEVMNVLDHPAIVKLRGSGVSEGVHWLAIDYIEGGDLKQFIATKGHLLVEDALLLLEEIASALDHAHANGYVHRDIKPSNIMIQGDDPAHALLMDFGIAKLGDIRTRYTASGAIGTIDYMAPEQILSAREVDHRADIYALAIVAYEMLTGEVPFKGSPAQVMFAQIQQPPPALRKLKPDVPSHVAQSIEQAMAKDPEDRFESAGEFVARLKGP